MLGGSNFDGKGYNLYSSSYINIAMQNSNEKYDPFLKPGSGNNPTYIYNDDVNISFVGVDFAKYEFIIGGLGNDHGTIINQDYLKTHNNEVSLTAPKNKNRIIFFITM